VVTKAGLTVYYKSNIYLKRENVNTEIIIYFFVSMYLLVLDKYYESCVYSVIPETTFLCIQLTLVISNSMGPWKKFESTIVRLKRSYEDTGGVVCLTTKGRQLERNFEELKPASHVPILGTILNIFDVFVADFFSLLNSLNLVKRLITSRYLFLCE
jgi:hypothetical protein